MKKPNKEAVLGFAANFGARFATRLLSNPQRFEKFLKQYLDEVMEKSSPDQLEYDFEHNVKLVNQIDPQRVEQVNQWIKQYNLDVSELLAKIRTYLPRFDKKWVMEWLYESHPEFYDNVVLHPQKDAYEKWIAQQIKDVGDFVVNSLS